jgi:hypothetical protein
MAGDPMTAGTWHLATPKEVKQWHKEGLDRRGDPRVLRLTNNLMSFTEWADVVVFEDVKFCSTTMQCQLYASFRTAVWLLFPVTKIEAVPVQTLKKFATGSGSATKEAMKRCWLNSHHFWRMSGDLDDNAIDACWLVAWAKENVKR